LQGFLLTWAALFGSLLAIYFGLGFLLSRVNRTTFGQRHRLQPGAVAGKAPPVAEQRRHASASLAGIAFLLAAGITLNRAGVALFPAVELTWTTGVAGALLSLVVYDTAFYWTHRWLHTPFLFKNVHGYHHRVRTPVPWTTNSESLLDGLVINAYWLAAPLLLPIPLEVLVAHRLWDMAMGVVGHSGHEYGGVFVLPPSPLVSVTHHDQHHRHSRCNYAVHFTFWDRLMGTLHKDHDRELRGPRGSATESVST
jgi:sterol desaturase/sphingolipid hydroxylase (fatty acid hydroxylase superfamily)